MEFNFTVRGDRITADKEYTFVEGNKGYYEAVFDFGEDEVWLSGAKICIVENKDKVYEIPVIGNRCILPEMLRGSSKIGVFCVVAENGGSERASTNMIAIGVQDGASGAEINAEMSTAAEVWEKYLSDIEQNRAAAEEARSKAEGAAFSAGQSASDSKQSADRASGSSTAAEEAKNAAESAKGDAEKFARQADGAEGRANTAANAAAGFADTAIASAESIRNMEVSAQGLPPGSAPKVIKSINPDGSINLHYLIPAGEKGEQGPQGAKGDKGADGHNPIKGVDYFTPEDIASLDIPFVELKSLKYYGDKNIVPTDNSFFSFETNDETMEATITRYIGAETSVVIPYEYKVNGKTYKITKSAELAFLQSSISEAIFPEGFKEFGDGDFVQSQLRKIVIPKSVSMLGSDMFFDSQLSIVYYMGTEEQWKSLESKSYAPLYMGKVVCLGEGNVIPVSQKYVESLLASGNGSPEEKINSLQYYGNADISPSDSSLFGFTPLSDGKSVELGSMGYPGELRGELVIPYGLSNGKFLVTEIMYGGFWEFGGTKVTFPSCIETIHSDAFSRSSVEEIVFCGQPDKIMAGAFCECTSLKKVYFKGTQAEWEAIVEPERNEALLNATVYFEYTDVSKAYVDKKTEPGSGGGGSDAEAINILKYYGDVNITPSPADLFFVNETYGDGVVVSSNNAPDTLTGELVIPYEIEYSGNRCKVTKIFDGGFWGARIEKLIIPSTVKEIGTYAFFSATGIKEIVFCGKTIDIGAESLGNSENMDIYYRGSQKEWDTNVTGKENIPQSATIHFLWT